MDGNNFNMGMLTGVGVGLGGGGMGGIGGGGSVIGGGGGGVGDHSGNGGAKKAVHVKVSNIFCGGGIDGIVIV